MLRSMRLFTRLRLARWLGPWVPPGAVAPAERSEAEVPASEGRPALRVWKYRPRRGRARGTYLISPGLHYQGPEDPRMDRFLRALAGAGFFVYAPFVPDYLALRVRPTAAVDLGRALDALWSDDDRPDSGAPSVFTISFGSLPALRVAGDSRWADRIGSLLVFGGYADFEEVVRFCLSPPPGRPHDPLNRPVVLMNLLEHLDGLPAGLDDVVDAWERYVRRVWGRPEMRIDERYRAIAAEEGAHLDGEERALFDEGVGLRPGAFERCCLGMEGAGEGLAHLDPSSSLGSIRCPVHLFHGRDDDVIPYEQMHALFDALPSSVEKARYLTGFYDHTGSAGPAGLRQHVQEAITLWRMLGAMSGPGR